MTGAGPVIRQAGGFQETRPMMATRTPRCDKSRAILHGENGVLKWMNTPRIKRTYELKSVESVAYLFRRVEHFHCDSG